MSFTDWCKNFTDADVCRIMNTSLISIHKTWNKEVNFGKWTRNNDPLLNRCGGCTNHRQTFLQNPQYLFDVTKESDEVLILLQQKDRKIYRKEGQGDNLSIGFNVLKVEVNRKYRLHDLVTQQLLHTSTYIDARTVFMRCELPQGRYVVMPTTFKPFIEGEFMLRLYTDVDSGCRLGITVADDGEFWMSFTDWCKNFTDVDICHLVNTSLISIHKNWDEEVKFGKWTRNSDHLLNRCGGCTNHKQTFLQNPQYLFDVTKESDEVLISLQQKDRRIYRKEGQGDNLIIGFTVLKVEVNRKYRLHKLVTQKEMNDFNHTNIRTVFNRIELPQGRYVIIPSTFEPFIEGEFMLRLYTDVDSGCRELVQDKPQTKCWTPLSEYPQVVTHIYVKKAEIGQQGDQAEGINPYVKISCEDQSVKSTTKKNSLTPVFEFSAIFYRKKVTEPLIVQLWSDDLELDKFLGEVVLPGRPDDVSHSQHLQLENKGSKTADNMPGKIILMIETSNELTAL
ncbi:calpain-5-like, partial [Poecilia reticulata]|uniref:calpain-5-like n=1 Tax=Poecilia reticulata TaxID=8081 RepID=UPI0004A3EF72